MSIEIIGTIATVLAVSGVVLNNNKSIWCFALFIVSNTLVAYVHYDARILSVYIRDMIFLGLAFDGIRRWRNDAVLKADGR